MEKVEDRQVLAGLGHHTFISGDYQQGQVYAPDAGLAFRLVKLRLLNMQLPAPLEDLTVTLLGLAGEAGRQGSLLAEVRQREDLREALRQLEARLGQRPPLYRVREVEPWSRIPERRRALVEYVP